jgi:hypothetical protein
LHLIICICTVKILNCYWVLVFYTLNLKVFLLLYYFFFCYWVKWGLTLSFNKLKGFKKILARVGTCQRVTALSSLHGACGWFRQLKNKAPSCRNGACRKQSSGLASMYISFFSSLSLNSCALPCILLQLNLN